MIGIIKGIVHSIQKDHVIVLTGGVGFQIFIPYRTLVTIPSVGESIELHTQLIVREDNLQLFGFIQEDEKKVFEMLVDTQGLGPKTALNILTSYDPYSIREIILNDDVTSLTTISGIGKKTAQRIILELKEKMHRFLPDMDHVPVEKVSAMKDSFNEAKEALLVLGYNSQEVDKAIREIAKSGIKAHNTQDIIKRALNYIKAN
jgi:Holliday junction DNA helicase RuvA